MNKAPLNRLAVVERIARGELQQAEAAALLGLSVRQTRRITQRYIQLGPEGLSHGLRGRPANNKTPEEVIRRAVCLVKTRYAKLGPKLAARRLAEKDGIIISRETLRQSMIMAGLWEPGRGRARPQPRPPVEPPVVDPADSYAWSSP
jgi:hypothetical protein